MMIMPGLTILIPHDGTRASVEKLRRWYAEKVKPVAAVWSIEYGHHGTGHHLNIISELIEDLAPPGARVLTDRIRSTVRATAAYITKRSQAPPEQPTRKRSTGYFGNITDILADSTNTGAVVRAAAEQQRQTTSAHHEREIATDQPSPGAALICAAEPQDSGRGAHTQPSTDGHLASADPNDNPMTAEEFHAITRHRLAYLYAINERLKETKKQRQRGIIKAPTTKAINQHTGYLCSATNYARPEPSGQ